MLKNDYILRMIEQMVQIIAHIGQSRDKGEYEAGHRQVDEGLKLLGVSRGLVSAMPGSELIWLLDRTGSFETERRLMLAKLLREDALIYRQQGDPLEAGNLLRGAAGVLETIAGGDCDERQKAETGELMQELRLLMTEP